MDLLDPILTCCAPEIVPETTMIRAVVSSFFALLAAAVNSARVETVVTVPPAPPLVLICMHLANICRLSFPDTLLTLHFEWHIPYLLNL